MIHSFVSSSEKDYLNSFQFFVIESQNINNSIEAKFYKLNPNFK